MVQYPGSLTAAQMILYLAGSDWTAACAAAWDERLRKLLEEIGRRSSAG